MDNKHCLILSKDFLLQFNYSCTYTPTLKNRQQMLARGSSVHYMFTRSTSLDESWNHITSGFIQMLKSAKKSVNYHRLLYISQYYGELFWVYYYFFFFLWKEKEKCSILCGPWQFKNIIKVQAWQLQKNWHRKRSILQNTIKQPEVHSF